MITTIAAVIFSQAPVVIEIQVEASFEQCAIVFKKGDEPTERTSSALKFVSVEVNSIKASYPMAVAVKCDYG